MAPLGLACRCRCLLLKVQVDGVLQLIVVLTAKPGEANREEPSEHLRFWDLGCRLRGVGFVAQGLGCKVVGLRLIELLGFMVRWLKCFNMNDLNGSCNTWGCWMILLVYVAFRGSVM